jgi:predicted SAM-dependent methyltransferase
VRGLLATGELDAAIRRFRENGLPLKIIVGAGNARDERWIATDIHVLDICSPKNWARHFEPNCIDCILSEHVLEHLTLEQNHVALAAAFRHLKPGGRFRIAVPDGNRRDEFYRADVAPPADGHQVLFDLKLLTTLLEEAGYTVRPLEYFDDSETFHAVEWSSEDGHVHRSARYDRQENFRRGDLFYTSLVVDAFKP